MKKQDEKQEEEGLNMATIAKPTVFEISVKTQKEKRDYEKMSKPVLSQKYINECIATYNKLRKKSSK